MVGLQTAEQCAVVVAEAGLQPWVWDTANRGWTARLHAAGPGSELVATHRRLLIAALGRLGGDAKPMDLDTYVAINVLIQAGTPPEDAFASFGQNTQSFSAGSYEWIDRLAGDPRLEVYFQLRVRKGIAEATGSAPRDNAEVYGPGNLVRGRRCHGCGGLKATKPSTAYVYCDYCAALFDYDPYVAIADPRAMDPGMVDQKIESVTVDALRAAFAAGDRDEYGRIARWRSEVSTEICPAAYSPRIRDPAYRRRFIDDVLVPWTVAMRFDPEARQAGLEVQDAQRRAEHRRGLPAVMELLHASQRLWQIEAALLEREGVFAAHPDGLDRALYLYVNASGFVRPWLAFLGNAQQQQLLTAAGVACEYIAMPSVNFAARSCGHCGQRRSIPADALRFVCESCGTILEAGQRAFSCTQCGASVCLASDASEAQCGHCGVRWTL